MADISELTGLLPGYRRLDAVDVSVNDYVHLGGFHLYIGAAGTVVYRSMDSDTDVSVTFTAAGLLGLSGIPVICIAVRTTSTATDMQAGVLLG